MRSYNPAYNVITPTGYLHEFKDFDVRSLSPPTSTTPSNTQQTMNKDHSPEISLYLPECVVSALKDGKFQISGKDAGSALKGLSTKHDFAFKATNAAEGVLWYDAIVNGAKANNKTGGIAAAAPAIDTTASIFTTPVVASPIVASPIVNGEYPPAYYGGKDQETGVAKAPAAAPAPVIVAGTPAPPPVRPAEKSA